MQGLLSLVIVAVGLLVQLQATPLDDYVWRYDENYKWVDLGQKYVAKGHVLDRGYTSYTLNLTSQRWLTDDYFKPNQAGSLWWHYMVVIVPDEIKHNQNATMWITGGSNDVNNVPEPHNFDILITAAIAVTTGTVSTCLFQVPNEHVTFVADPMQKSRSEDGLIAYTWDAYLNDTSNPEILVRFPMVKASLRAMDATKEFLEQVHPEYGVHANYFGVSGGSKRGWTTWLVGAVDPNRVKVIAPVVLDAINFVAVEHHHYRSYGGWSYALHDYYDQGLMARFDDPNMVHLQEMEDPYFYRDRLTMPKFIVNAVMDEFQQPDDTHYWWNDMPEPKHFLIVPNAEHSLATGIFAAIPSISAWLNAHLTHNPIPKFDWTINKTTGELVATIQSGKVHSAQVWWAHSCGNNNWDNGKMRRDYRIGHLDNPCACGFFYDDMCANLKAFWDKKTLKPTTVNGKETYSAQFDASEDGRWTAFVIAIQFKNPHIPAGLDPADLNAVFKANPDTPAGKLALEFSRYFENFGGFAHDFAHFYEFTTEVSVYPDTFPYPDCVGAACQAAPQV